MSVKWWARRCEVGRGCGLVRVVGGWVSWECSAGTYVCLCFFFQAEDGIRDLVRSRGLGDVYKRQLLRQRGVVDDAQRHPREALPGRRRSRRSHDDHHTCLLYTSDAADERSSVDLGGRRIIKKKNQS